MVHGEIVFKKCVDDDECPKKCWTDDDKIPAENRFWHLMRVCLVHMESLSKVTLVALSSKESEASSGIQKT